MPAPETFRVFKKHRLIAVIAVKDFHAATTLSLNVGAFPRAESDVGSYAG
jgi:hypothetical protein